MVRLVPKYEVRFLEVKSYSLPQIPDWTVGFGNESEEGGGPGLSVPTF